MNKIVYLITERNLQMSLLEEKLRDSFTIRLIPPVDVITNTNTLKDQVVLIDVSFISGRDVEVLISHLNVHGHLFSIAIFNTDRSQNVELLLEHRNIKGIFYSDDSLEMLEKGIDRLISGGYWLSRKIMEHMIGCDRQSVPMLTGQDSKLTKREKQILELVATGVTNTEIAKKIFVSENTVKTHLSNLYRKLEIRNRTQASAWVQNQR